MRKLWKFLSHHFREDFSKSYYVSIAFLLSTLLFLNYQYRIEKDILDSFKGIGKLIVYFLFYAGAYYLSFFLLTITSTKPKHSFFQSSAFWKYSLVGLAILALDSSMPFLQDLIYDNLHRSITYWSYKVAVNGISFFTVLVPILLFYYFNDRQSKHQYGLNNQHTDLSIYWTLLLLMIPLLVSASFLESFQRQYPMYKSNEAYLSLGIPEWTAALIYELAYGLDFITVELLFRGFLVIGMMKLVGRNAIVPMVVIYCLLHFGKPAGEAISSIAGGYILGVIAYETKSIWGGIIIHMGIAWLMEITAFIQKLFH